MSTITQEPVVLRKTNVEGNYPTEIHLDPSLENFFDYEALRRIAKRPAEHFMGLVDALRKDRHLVLRREEKCLKVSLDENQAPQGISYITKQDAEAMILVNTQYPGTKHSKEYGTIAEQMSSAAQSFPNLGLMAPQAKLGGQIYDLSKRLDSIVKDTSRSSRIILPKKS